MRVVDETTLRALEGSRQDTLTVWAWRDGELVVPEPLQVLSWSFADDAGDSHKVNQKVSFTVADPDGTLGAWKFDDPLGVGGTRLQVVYRVGGAGAINYGWFRIVDNQPTEAVSWRTLPEYGLDEPDSDTPPHERQVPVITAVVKLEAADLTDDVDRDKFEAPESPGPGATVLSEFERLMGGHFPVIIDPGITDVPVPPKTVYDKNRLEDGQDLLSRVNARYRMGGDGECHVYPRNAAPVLRVGPRQAMVTVSRKQSISGLFNRWIVQGKDSGDSAPVRAVVSLDSGPLRYGGPHGKVPDTYTSETITSYEEALAYATLLRDQFLGSLAVVLSVVTAPRPELQGGDRIEVGCPVAAGHVIYIPGEITGISRQGETTPGPTTLTVSCSYSDVVTALSRTEWADDLTGTMPELTWDRMPASWGNLPDWVTWNDLP